MERQQVTVAVRVRPAALNERRGAFKSMVRVLDGNVVIFDPRCTDEFIEARELRRSAHPPTSVRRWRLDHQQERTDAAGHADSLTVMCVSVNP